mmetsp:Transcript_80496/g.260836  ORF Transcript_80496/g.260836 Transcript_80496/m.260836 type:complete len:245 (-) Transcript_80496:197-931(-)
MGAGTGPASGANSGLPPARPSSPVRSATGRSAPTARSARGCRPWRPTHSSTGPTARGCFRPRTRSTLPAAAPSSSARGATTSSSCRTRACPRRSGWLPRASGPTCCATGTCRRTAWRTCWRTSAPPWRWCAARRGARWPQWASPPAGTLWPHWRWRAARSRSLGGRWTRRSSSTRASTPRTGRTPRAAASSTTTPPSPRRSPCRPAARPCWAGQASRRRRPSSWPPRPTRPLRPRSTRTSTRGP